MAETVFGGDPDWQGDDIAVVRPRDIELRIVTPAGFDALYPGLDFSRERVLPALAVVTFAVDSLAAVREVFAKTDVQPVETFRGTLAVPRQQARRVHKLGRGKRSPLLGGIAGRVPKTRGFIALK
jgi:hypothetical protein